MSSSLRSITPSMSSDVPRVLKKKSSVLSKIRSLPRRNSTGASVTRSFPRRGSAPARMERVPNALQWIESSCPQELAPKILAYCGPRMAATLQQTNRFWKRLLEQDSTWKILCEELYKWNPEKDDKDDVVSWKEYYRLNPCVPVDYSTPCAALAVATSNSHKSRKILQDTSVRILLRPGKYVLTKALVIQTTPHATVSFEAMEMPPNIFTTSTTTTQETPPSSPKTKKSRPHRAAKKTLRQLMSGCRSIDAATMEYPAESTSQDEDEDSIRMMDDDVANRSNASLGPAPNSTHQETAMEDSSSSRVVLVLKTRRQNEPLCLVRQGNLIMKNMDLMHHSSGMDIWNGNAAIQIQPSLIPEALPLIHPRPRAILQHLRVTSFSGRGIVNIEGGHVAISSCRVVHCAATGIYIGGPGTEAVVDRTDVVANGNGKQPRGIARGHSGVYLEQGHAKILDCNISRNSLAGISAVSSENAVLELQHSDLVGNGTMQLEIPPPGTPARNRSLIANNNHLANTGCSRNRSGL